MTFVDTAARLCHEANRAICECAGDLSQKPWDEAEQWQRDSAMAGVMFRLNNPNATGEAQHGQWCADKLSAGWMYGPVKDAENKTHPCLVGYDSLPFEQRVKDHVFSAIVNTLKITESYGEQLEKNAE